MIAIRKGYLDIVKYAVELGVDEYDKIAKYATLYGHLDIVKYAVELGARNYEEIKTYTLHPDIAEYINSLLQNS